MHKNVTNFFAVIYIPFYALQCARQKRILERSALNNSSIDQLSFDVIEADIPRVGERGLLDDDVIRFSCCSFRSGRDACN